MTVLEWRLVVLLAYYVFFVMRVVVGLRRLEHQERTAALPHATVVIAARNEELTIGDCIRSVLAQDYPSDALRIVVVDDASTDATAEVVRRAAEDDGRVTLVSLPPKPEDGIGGKPAAIRAGVGQAASEIVLTTDADCVHPPSWVRSMVSHFTASTAMVAGPVDIAPGSTLFSRIERLDFLGLVISGAGSIGAGRPIICNGANLAYRRAVYVRALDQVQRSSNDDGTLMSRIVSRGLGRVTFASRPEAVVVTQGQGDLRSFFRQRRRWAAVRGRFLDPSIYVELVLLFAFFAVLLVGSIAAVLSGASWPTILGVWVIKSAIDLLPLLLATKTWKIDRRWSDILLAELFHPFSIVISTLLSIASPFRWKERTLVR